MTGFDSKRQETLDFLRSEEEQLQQLEADFALREEQNAIYREWALAVFALLGMLGASAATGFYFGVMYVVQGSWLK